MSLDQFLISEHASLRDTLVKIDANHYGFVLTVNNDGVVTGLATDGDIRRKLIDGSSLDDIVMSFANPNFVWADSVTPRELVLKQLDQHIKAIPILDNNRRLIGLASRDFLPALREEPVYARARAPVRISFSGGGSDLTYFFVSDGGAVINATISLYSHATLRKREDDQIIIHSRDIGSSLHAVNLQHALAQKGPFALIQALLKTVHPDFGFELYLHSDFPIRSGLGGSAVVSAAVLGCFNQFRQDRWDSHEVAELAFQAERLYLGVAGGWQDQYATVFGGFNFMEFRMDQNIVHPLRIHPDILLELEESLVLCDTGTSHDSGDIHLDQRNQIQRESVYQKLQSHVELTYRMRNHLLRGRLLQFGQSMHEAWEFKRQFSSKISNSRLDRIYEDARNHGAIGGKLLGAGGGGFFVFYVTPFRKHELISELEAVGLKVHPFRFDQEGLRVCSTREHNSH